MADARGEPPGEPAADGTGEGTAEPEPFQVTDLEASVFAGRERLSPRALADRLGVDVGIVADAWAAVGLAGDDLDAPTLTAEDAETVTAFVAASELFGPDATRQFSRVMASSLARMAHAAMTLAHTRLQGPMAEAGAGEDELRQAGEQANLALEMVAGILDPLFRHHALVALRSQVAYRATVPPTGAHDRGRLAVGFVDLVGSTALFARTDPTDLSRALTDLEAVAADHLARTEGRVVKQIGDELLLVGTDVGSLCRTALSLGTWVREHPLLSDVRASLDLGEVVLADGDVFGPVVNRAARLVATAEPGRLLVTAPVADALLAAGAPPARPCGTRRLRDVPEPVATFEVTAA